MGLKCHLTEKPVGQSYDESKEMAAALEQALYSDMFAMFVIQYAKEYKVEKGNLPSEPKASHPLGNAGTAVLSLCGATNKYCAIAGLVLKTADELSGSRHNGSTSSTVTATGKIRRDFSKDTYHVAEGGSVINMRVRASNR
jgi:hypothetical protein